MSLKTNPTGLLLLDKPSGITSHDAVAIVRKIFKTKEVGHTGTLDPLASGLMVLLLGEATKLSSYITDGDKAYDVQIKPGVETDTLDITGQVLSEKPVNKTPEEIAAIALKLSGEISLPIPLYSAKKIDGKKLYEYARDQEEVQVPQKVMSFWNIENHSVDHKLSFHLHCSKGSFIRSWVKLLGEHIGCGATMSGLRRTQSSQFLLKNAVNLETLKASAEPMVYLHNLELALGDIKQLKVSGHDFHLLKNGQISHDLRQKLIIKFNPETDKIIQIIDPQKKLLALVGLEPEKGFRIKRIFN